MSNNFFGGHNFNRHAFLAAYMDVHHRPRPLSSPSTVDELRAVADAVAVANARRPLVHEGADRPVSLVLAQGHDINVDADRLVGEGVDADTDPYADELELARDSEVEEDDEDEWKIEKMEVIRKLREENEESTDLRFSRACTACDVAEPRRRVVCTRCGHTVCRECVDARLRLVCPTCQSAASFVKLCEEQAAGGQGFSRACTICVTDCPRARAYFTRCGHIVCLACALQLQADADADADADSDADDSGDDEDEIQVCCPMCRTEGYFEELKERLEHN